MEHYCIFLLSSVFNRAHFPPILNIAHLPYSSRRPPPSQHSCWSLASSAGTWSSSTSSPYSVGQLSSAQYSCRLTSGCQSRRWFGRSWAGSRRTHQSPRQSLQRQGRRDVRNTPRQPSEKKEKFTKNLKILEKKPGKNWIFKNLNVAQFFNKKWFLKN